jgi:tetratricopeptide (TPR) repeat protein
VKKGEEEDVRNILLSLHRKEPKNIFIKEKLGIALLAKGYSIEEVLSMIEKNEADALYLEGILSIASQQFYLMAGCKFAEAAERDPSFLLSKMRELWVYKEIGLKKNAEEVYCQLLQEIPGSGLCDLYMSKLHTNIGEPETATLYAKRAVRKEPLLSVAYLALANAHYYENRFISALLSYRKGLFLSADRSHLYSYLQEAFCRRYFPMFAAGYLIVWAITLFLLLLVHYVGIFLIRGYPTLSRYVVKKRWLFYLYIMNTGILFLSCVFGKETFRFIPLNILKEIFLFLTIILPIAIFSILGLAILLSFAVKWPKLRIYLSFVLLDFSLDIAIILMMASLIPVFCDYPKVFTAFAAFGIIFRRFGVAALILAIFLFYLWYSTSINRGYSLIEKGEMDKGISLFRRLRSSIGFIFWLEPTYSDMVASAIMGEVYALTKREKWEEISMLWKPIEKSLKDWWPLNVRARFFYEWSVALSKAKTDNVSEAKRDVERMLEVSEFEKRRPAIEALSALIKAKEPKIEHLKDKELKRILRGIR